MYREFSASSSNEHQRELAGLAKDVKSLYDLPEATDVLALPVDAPNRGVTYPVHGLVGVNPRIFKSPEVAVFVGVHEAVHATLGHNETSRVIDDAAPNFRRHFHGALVPLWLAGEITFKENEDYLEYRRYDGLVPGGWYGPDGVDQATMQGTLANYFTLVRRDLIQALPNGMWAHNSPDFRSWKDDIQKAKIKTPLSFNGREAWLSELVLTGMELGNILGHYWRNNIPEIDLGEWEEGLANRIASDVSGVNLEAAQSVAPQDIGQIALAHRIKEAGHDGRDLADNVRSYRDLYRLAKSVG